MKPHNLWIMVMMTMTMLMSGCSPRNGNAPVDHDGATADNRHGPGRQLEKAVFAGGCFWCMEPPFQNLDGVIRVRSGYTGGHLPDPTYQDVVSGASGHLEAIEIEYDPGRITYDRLLEVFWRQIDPTDEGGSFVDRGPQYRPAIFYHNEEQRQLAEASRQALDASGRFERPVATQILPGATFYPAEEYHQDYHRKNPVRYKLYRSGSGRDRFINTVWRENPVSSGDKTGAPEYVRPPDDVLKKTLTPLQYDVTRRDKTEPPFNNACWDNKAPGLYVDVVSGEPLFSSRDKFDSGTGWPSFTRTVRPEAVIEKKDRTLLMTRTEVRSRLADSHLGHVFDDGPPPTGRRYCINSAALRFIALEDLEKEGYGDFGELVRQVNGKKF